jgi:hypothetical protein
MRRFIRETLRSPGRISVVTVVAVLVAAGSYAADSTSTPSSASTTSTTTSTILQQNDAAAGHITAGSSRSECLTPNTGNGQNGFSYLQSFINNFDTQTGTTVTCVSSYLNGSQNWSAWVNPWITGSRYGYTTWVAQEPASRELVLEMNLIPNDLDDVNNPLTWERACVAGHYDSYATQLGNNLVAAGLQNSVIRLGAEMNGVWEGDFIGTKASEQKLWAKCFDNEVTGLREASGQHFLIDWNVNACVGNYPYANYYPGNAYVDIMGLDLYDVGCETPKTSLTFQQLANEPAGLTHFEAFAKEKGKPMSFPEWGLSTVPAGDDPGYINGMGSTIANGNFAFESYFEGGGVNVKALPLGSSTPLSLVAFRKWFGPSQ